MDTRVSWVNNPSTNDGIIFAVPASVTDGIVFASAEELNVVYH